MRDFEVFITYAAARFLPVEAAYKTNLLRRRMHVVTVGASANIFVHFSWMTLLEFRSSMGRYFQDVLPITEYVSLLIPCRRSFIHKKYSFDQKRVLLQGNIGLFKQRLFLNKIFLLKAGKTFFRSFFFPLHSVVIFVSFASRKFSLLVFTFFFLNKENKRPTKYEFCRNCIYELLNITWHLLIVSMI